MSIPDVTSTDPINDYFGNKADGFSKPSTSDSSKIEEVDPDNLPVIEEGKSDKTPKSDEEDDDNEAPMGYRDRLEKLKVSDDKANEIIDDMCEKGSYLEAYTVRKARKNKEEVKVVFLTRDTRSQGFIANYASKHHNNLPVIYNKLMGELQLAASILHYNGQVFSPLSEIEDDDEFGKQLLARVRIFSKLPAPISVVLYRFMGQFDIEVAAVMAPGYEDFF